MRGALFSFLLLAVACTRDGATGGRPTTTRSSGPALTTTIPTGTTSTTVDPRRLRSDAPLALALDDTIVTPSELSQTGRSWIPIAPESTPEGPLSADGVGAAFGALAHDPLEKARPDAGARHTYRLELTGTAGPVVDILAVKFPSSDAGATFSQSLTAIAVQAEGAQRVDHPDASSGLLPGVVLRAPPGPRASVSETVWSSSLYVDGVFYLVTFLAAPGTVADADVLALLRGQDQKYHARASALASTVTTLSPATQSTEPSSSTAG